MSPDSAEATPTRRAWRILSASAFVLASASILLTAVKWTGADDRQDRQGAIAQKAICSIVSYAEVQADTIRRGMPARDGQPARPGNPRAARSLDKLAGDMRETGIQCPPRTAPRP